MVKKIDLDRFFNNKDINENRLLSLKNKEKGNDVIIIGTSSTINKNFIDSIRDKITIGTSGIVYCRDAWQFEPTYYCQGDPMIWRENKVDEEFFISGHNSLYDRINRLEKSIKVYSDFILWPIITNPRYREPLNREDRLKLLRDNAHVKFINDDLLAPPFGRIQNPKFDDISFNLISGTFLGGTIVQDLAIPLAAWMGAKNIYIKGCTLEPIRHFYDKLSISRDYSNESKRNQVRGQYYNINKKLNEYNINLYNLDTYGINGIHYCDIKDIL